MGQRYDTFVMPDPSCYDAMHYEQIAGKYLPAAERLLPDGWRCFFFAPRWVTRKTVVVENLAGTHIENGGRR